MPENLERKFTELVKTHFEFLIQKHDFKLTQTKIENFSSNVQYQRPELAFVLQYDYRDFMCFFWLVRVINNGIPEYPIFVKQDKPVNWFDFNTVLFIKAPEMILDYKYFGERLTEENLEGWLKHQVECLKKYGQDLLVGDIRIFEELERIVKERASE